VVRYFGGTLLGTGGLINAYRESAKDAIQNSTIIEKRIERKYEIVFSYEISSQVMKIVKDNELTVLLQQFDVECKITVAIPINKINLVISKLQHIESIQIHPI